MPAAIGASASIGCVFCSHTDTCGCHLQAESLSLLASGGRSGRLPGDPTEFYVKDVVEAALAGKAVSVGETRAQGCSVEYVQK